MLENTLQNPHPKLIYWKMADLFLAENIYLELNYNGNYFAFLYY